MALRILEIGNSLPTSILCDRSISFEAGMVAELVLINNQVVATLSNGSAPLGIIDDTRTRAFTNVSWNETVYVSVPGEIHNGQMVAAIDVKAELRKPNIIKSSFTSTVSVGLNPVNGVITFLAGTPLNVDLTGSGTPNGIKAIVSYTYEVANVPGDDTTAGSDRITVWYQRMFFATSVFETNQPYPLRANLYVSKKGMLTTEKHSENLPCIATVTSPPSPQSPMLHAMWY